MTVCVSAAELSEWQTLLQKIIFKSKVAFYLPLMAAGPTDTSYFFLFDQKRIEPFLHAFCLLPENFNTNTKAFLLLMFDGWMESFI